MQDDFGIQIIYASTSGNVEAVAETISELLTNSGHQTFLHRAERTSPEIFSQNPYFILGTSTWEHGALNPFFDKLNSEMKEMQLSGKQAAFFGCGDRRYEPVFFNEGIEIVRRTFLDSGGRQLGETLKIDGDPYGELDTLVRYWVAAITPEFKSQSST